MSEEVKAAILKSVSRLRQHLGFAEWLASENSSSGDILLVNNSFVFRDVKTNKADTYISLLIKDPPNEPEIAIATGIRFNKDFKRIAAASADFPRTSALADAIKPQLLRLGQLVFLLIGEIQDCEIAKTTLNQEGFSFAVWDPSIQEEARVEADRIIVKNTDNEDSVWTAIAAHYELVGNPAPDGLREALGIALDHLQDQAVARVQIPLPGKDSGFGITDAILAVLREQRDEYASAVEVCDSAGAVRASLNDILRISYNFASDATGFLRLIVSICDLKPVVLWGTIAEHYALSAAFRSLPWSRSKRKPSLKNYQQSISDARNSAFHNLFPFRKSLRVPLPEAALGAPELQIFSEHGKKSSNQLKYQDKELVDVLVEFTRARERHLSMSFWRKNLEVMNATIALFERTNDFIKLLAGSRVE